MSIKNFQKEVLTLKIKSQKVKGLNFRYSKTAKGGGQGSALLPSPFATHCHSFGFSLLRTFPKIFNNKIIIFNFFPDYTKTPLLLSSYAFVFYYLYFNCHSLYPFISPFPLHFLSFRSSFSFYPNTQVHQFLSVR